MSPPRRILLAAAVLAAAAPLQAQSWRTLVATRQRQPVDTLHVRVQYGAGRMTLGAAPRTLLYDVRLRYDADQFRPAHAYDPASHTLTVGADSETVQMFSLDPRHVHFATREIKHGSDFTLGLARDVPLDLTLGVGAADARIDLTDLTVRRLRMETVAGDSRVTFGTENRSRIPELFLRTSAASITVSQLGNAHADTVRAAVTAGSVDLDLSGPWTGTTTLDLRAVLGGITLRVPNDVGVKARVSKVLGGFDVAGLTEHDGAYYSANWNRATRRVVIDADVVLAGVDVVWQP